MLSSEPHTLSSPGSKLLACSHAGPFPVFDGVKARSMFVAPWGPGRPLLAHKRVAKACAGMAQLAAPAARTARAAPRGRPPRRAAAPDTSTDTSQMTHTSQDDTDDGSQEEEEEEEEEDEEDEDAGATEDEEEKDESESDL